MRIASRHMPKLQTKSLGWLGCSVGALLAGAFAYLVVADPKAIAVVLGLTFVAFVLTRPGIKREEEHLRALAEARVGHSICEFAREFDLRAVDPWIVRAVYEQLQKQLEHVHPSFPLHAEDRLKEELHLDGDDVDMEVVVQVEHRTGRSLANADANPYYGKVRTVRDLVMFFQFQGERVAA